MKSEGVNSISLRIKVLFHQCYNKIFEKWADLTSTIKHLLWADGFFRASWLFVAGIIVDQPEADTANCDGSQSCKCCKCPGSRMNEAGPHAQFEKKTASEVKRTVRDTYAGQFPGWEDGPEQRKNKRSYGEPRATRLFISRRGSWTPTDSCTNALYHRVKKAIGAVHLMENAFWKVPHFDIQQQVYITH
jgi:hypothetical protein